MPAFSFDTHANAFTVHEEYTFVYKHREVDIPVDVFIPTTPEAKAAREKRGGSLPVCFWIHGGGAVQGGRTERYQHLLEGVGRVPFVGVFPDYRLCPQVRLEDQLEDVADAFKWTVTSLQDELRKKDEKAPTLELDQIIVKGNSMGGFYSLCLPLGALPGLHISDPKAHPFLARIRATAPIYPVADVGNEFWSVPQVPFGGLLPVSLDEVMKEFADPQGPVITNTNPEGPPSRPGFNRNLFYPWTQSKANLRGLLFGPDPVEQKRWLSKLNMYTHIDRYVDEIKTVVGSASPHSAPLEFFVVHGDADAAVPVTQSRSFVELARRLGFKVQYEEYPGADHLFDAHLIDVQKFDGLYLWMRRLTNAPTQQPTL